jgi:3D (Asp-Asp-Asp) domain-containing protein
LTNAELRSLALAVLAAFIAIVLLTSCGTTRHPLPQYEAPLARSDFQTVRTTAYTHTEADHREFTNHNALGGELHAAGPPIHRAENVVRAIPVDATEDVGIRRDSSAPPLQPFSMTDTRTTTTVKTIRISRSKRGVKRAIAVAKPPPIGSAAADWSRWPMGTTFRLLSTGQMYRVDDYGWALSGRNTIDLYMANPRDMDSWGAREELIQILQWGDPRQSLQLLQSHQDYRHIKRMVLELEGRNREAAALQ